MKSIALILFLAFCSFFAFCIELSGMHGHLMFRPWMTEDWGIWGIILAFGLSAIWLTILKIKNRRK